MPSPRLALAVAAVAIALTVSGCTQLPGATDGPGAKQGNRTITPPTVLRTPVVVPDAPATAPLRGQDDEDAEAGENG